MKSAVETLNPTRVRLTVEVPFEELKPSLDAAYKKIAGQVNVPGFRKGKVPPQIIDQRFGRAAVLDEAVNSALPQFYGEAVQASEIQVLGQPAVDVTEFADGADLKFTVEVDVRPTFELPTYRGVAVTVDDAEVTDADVDEQLETLRERFATLIAVERPAESGDNLTIDLSGSTKEGQEIPDAQATGLSYVVGSTELVDGLDDAVLGMAAGESKTFSSTLVAGPRKDEEVDIEVTVTAVKARELPELDEEFAQTASEHDTVSELRADVSTRLAQQKLFAQGGQARDKVLEAVLAAVEVPLPQGFLDAEVEFRRNSINQQLEASGLRLDAYLEHEGKTQEEFDAEISERAREAMKAQFVLDEIAKAEEVTVAQEEITHHIISRAQSLGVSPDQFAQQVVEAGQAQMLVAEIVRGKALAILLEEATITDASGRPVDLSALDAIGDEGHDHEGHDHDHEHEGHEHEGHEHEGHDHGDDVEGADTETVVDVDGDEAPVAVASPATSGAASIAIPSVPDRD